MTNETIRLLLDHTSVRQFTDEPVAEETIKTILRCAQRAPTSSYLQAYTIIKVTDPEKRRALAAYAGGQEWVEKAPLALLFCADLHRVQRLAPPEDGSVLHNAELFTVAVSDAALAAQKALISAQACGLGGVVVGGVRNETEKMARLFDLPELVFPMYLLCLGHPAEVPPQRPRLDLAFVCGEDGYPALPTAEELAAYDREVGDYFRRTTAGRSSRGWTDRVRHALSQKPRYSVGAFLKKAGFLTKETPQE